MGYSYGRSATGRMVLCCDECGRAGGASKRRCPVGYCPPAAMCSADFAAAKADGRWAEWHADCPRLHDKYVAEQAEKVAHPEQWARAAWGDWAEGVPEGMVKVLTHADTVVLVPKADYNPSVAGFGR